MSTPSSKGSFDDVPIIFSYSREQALEDGVLVDVSVWAAETGFVIPVACTSAVWHQLIVPPKRTQESGQSERGRAHDVLWTLFNAIKRQPKAGTVLFKVIFLASPNRHKTVTLKSVIGPGDSGEPVITIMLPEED
jgi:hypothetical protein